MKNETCPLCNVDLSKSKRKVLYQESLDKFTCLDSLACFSRSKSIKV